MAQLPMPTRGGSTPPDPGDHTALALVNPRFVPPNLNHLSKEEEPPDTTQVCLLPVPVLTASYHHPDAAVDKSEEYVEEYS